MSNIFQFFFVFSFRMFFSPNASSNRLLGFDNKVHYSEKTYSILQKETVELGKMPYFCSSKKRDTAGNGPFRYALCLMERQLAHLTCKDEGSDLDSCTSGFCYDQILQHMRAIAMFGLRWVD